MKLMKIYQIQKNYQLHKDRLLSINTVNNKGRIIASLQSNINKINNYKRNKIQTEVFHEKERFDKITSENCKIRNKMIEVHSRENSLVRENSKHQSSCKSLKNININTKLTKQNAKFKERLLNTKSNYYHTNTIKKRNLSTTKRKNQVIYLLESQLGIKPVVVFPKLKTSSRQTNSVSRLKKSNFRSYTEHNTESFNSQKEKHTGPLQYSIDL